MRVQSSDEKTEAIRQKNVQSLSRRLHVFLVGWENRNHRQEIPSHP